MVREKILMKYILISNLSYCFDSSDNNLVCIGNYKLNFNYLHYPPSGFLCENGIEIICWKSGQRSSEVRLLDIFKPTPLSIRLDDTAKDFIEWYKKKYL